MTTVGIITCDGREQEYRNTLSQLVALGAPPDITMSGPCYGRVEDNRYKAFKMAVYAKGQGSGLLFLEDDIDLAPTLPDFLQRAVAHERLTTFCVMRDSLYPDNFERRMKFMSASAERGVQGGLIELPLERVQARRGFHGTQAVYLPPVVLETILESPDEFVGPDGQRADFGSIRHGLDFWLKDNAHHFGGMWAAYPNPVQHRSAPSTYGGTGIFTSSSYGLAAYFEEDVVS
jgi:hypothetical protein